MKWEKSPCLNILPDIFSHNEESHIRKFFWCMSASPRMKAAPLIWESRNLVQFILFLINQSSIFHVSNHQLHILHRNSNPIPMYRRQVGRLHHAHNVGLHRLLYSREERSTEFSGRYDLDPALSLVPIAKTACAWLVTDEGINRCFS